MSVPVEVPTLGESVTEAIIAEWLKKEGDFVEEDEIIAELETDKITVEVPAPVAGTIKKLRFAIDDSVNPGDVIADIEPGESKGGDAGDAKAEASADVAPKAAAAAEEGDDADHDKVGPAVRRLVEENSLELADIKGTGPGGRVTKGDVLAHIKEGGKPAKKAAAQKAVEASRPAVDQGALEERVTMSKLRQTVARRLVEAQHNAAMLTTFNEVDMTEIMALRKQYQDRFVKKYGFKLGFMSFFIKASIEALKAFPSVNAEIDGDDIVYKNYYNIGVAVGGGRGLVVPVLKNADQYSFAQTEQELGKLVDKAVNNKLTLPELQGGTFTISNGGIYGSMLSTPILNPPQSGILGMHNIVERPVAINGKVEIRPIMYLALSYDHRIIDGREAVSFLVRIKECLENPERILLEV
ncbi:2-oxoglutarate dehydrogenase complex dihydrolipoyllysine-residue succinyltransferase [Bradymonadaceae bacterium TMQ3]|nr:2-oxoglutarate dehydrogenase complex dihydrolipoyllysine-residue succinyltransferase [Bradymonadaceae bacterium TMQ3]TXC74725.1 2-oxoglutarate dehydrogenase complex dihydrolipoyllysine-residue succinyltransferase [Bradymonadales bacterium TMQ1]